MFEILLTLIFIRPFISSLAFPYANFTYSACLLIFLVLWLIYKGVTIKKIQILKYPLILFSLAIIISTIFSIDKFNSLREIYKYVTGLFLFLIITSLTSKERIRIIRTIILAGLIISLLAVYQYFFGFQNVMDYIARKGITDYFTLDYLARRRVYLPFATPNALAGYLILVLPLVLIIKDKKRWIILLSIFFALLLTKSLGAFLSIFLVSIIYFYLEGKLEKRKVIFLLGLLVIMGLVFMARSTTQKQHTQPIFSTTMRLSYWKDTLEIIKESPFTGVGLGNFNLAQSRYAHNSYLQLWAEMGILGIISILWLVATVFKSALKNIPKDTQKNQIISLIAANTVFLTHNFVDFTFFLPEVALIWWILIGLSIPCVHTATA